MPRRQIILLVFMGLALAYGGYTLLTGGASSQPQSAVDGPKLEATIKTVTEAVDKGRLTDLETFRLARVAPEAVGDPFLRADESGKQGEGLATAVDDTGRFVFSGVVSLGRRSIAVINDSEYKIGEVVGSTGFTLAEIRPDAVVLRGRDPESGTLQNLVVSIQDDLINFVEDGDAQK